MYQTARRRWASLSLHQKKWSLFRLCHKVQCGASICPGTPLKVIYPIPTLPIPDPSPCHTPRIAGLCKDYCGVLNEEAIRLNFVLVYELLDEVLVSSCKGTFDQSSLSGGPTGYGICIISFYCSFSITFSSRGIDNMHRTFYLNL